MSGNVRWGRGLRAWPVAVVLTAAIQAVGQEAPVDPATQPTTIDARSLDVNYEKNIAIFVGDVVVVDPQLRLTSDRLTVVFDPETNRVADIAAEGRVKIRQSDKNAEADRATYTVGDGRILLEGHARVFRERDILTAETIVFFRDEERMIAEPNPRLTLYPSRGGVQERLFDSRNP